MLRFILELSGGYLKSIRARLCFLVKSLSSVMEALTSSAIY